LTKNEDSAYLKTTLQNLLGEMLKLGASDLHLTVGAPPLFRIDGKLHEVGEDTLDATDTLKLAYSIMSDDQRKRFEKHHEVDFAFTVTDVSRFRANIFVQSGYTACAFRLVPETPRGFNELGLPPVVEKLVERPNGLILVTGPTGSGKSTTLAAMVDKINSEQEFHIITIEDPIEFIHTRKKSIVSQREVYQDTESFASALKVTVRQDPDVVLVGEMRDYETVQTALTVAETGHLTLATLHTNSAARTINRIIDIFPAEQKSAIRSQLSMVIEGVVSQVLLPQIGGGRILACEVLVATPAVRALIRENKVYQIPGIMEISQQHGMQSLNDSLADLVKQKLVKKSDALSQSPDPEQLQNLIK